MEGEITTRGCTARAESTQGGSTRRGSRRARRGAARTLAVVCVSAGLGTAAFGWYSSHSNAGEVQQTRALAEASKAGFDSILIEDLRTHVDALAGPELEGRDSPSPGLELAAKYIEQAFETLGLEPGLPGAEGYRHTFYRKLPAPVPAGCSLEVSADRTTQSFELGTDFVPVAYCGGKAEGELVFSGFGIRAKKERYDDLAGPGLEGAVALILEGEPRHPKRFDGDELTPYATLWEKLDELSEANVAGVLVVRRPEAGLDQIGAFGFRHTWATWTVERMTPVPGGLPRKRPPVLELTPECATALLGEDVLALAADLDRTAKAAKPRRTGRRVSMGSEASEQSVPIDNVVGLLRGSDPDLADEVVVIGAHYDHVGVDDRGRIGHGADDNASGTAAVIELAGAFAASRPPRSVLFCAFAAEEDGLRGSAELCGRPPFPAADMVAMLNMDMIGRGSASEVAVIGVQQNPDLGKVLTRAGRLRSTGVKKTVTNKGRELWQRSDHYSFHRIGVPTLFFFEGLPISRNPDYHTWRDTIDELDFDKIARTTRLVFNTAWLLANDAKRPSAPRD